MLPRDLPANQVLTYAQRAERLGFDQLWVVEDLTFQFKFDNFLRGGTGVTLNVGGKTLPFDDAIVAREALAAAARR